MSDKKKHHKRNKIILFLEIILILIAGALALFLYTFEKLDNVEWADSDIYTNTLPGDIEGYTNIAIFGVDSRENDLTKNTRSDSIIIASINNRSKKVKLVSLYRDTYVYIPDHGYTKLNHAYAYGGPKLAIETINRNFDLNITDFVTVNFSAVTDIVDALGGITVNITKEELKQVNRYAKDVANINNKEWTKIEKPGEQTLTGVQATGYCRVRYTAGGDFTRAERQRTVISAILAKAKSHPVKVVKAMNTVLPQISTGMDKSELAKLSVFLPFYNIDEQTGFPFENKTTKINGASVVLPTTLSSNVSELHKYLFEINDYQPSSTVEDINSHM